MTHEPDTEHPVRRAVAAGTSLAAAVLLLTVGVISILEGISAIVADQLYVVGFEYLYRFDTTSWGWTHTVLGTLLALCAVGLMLGFTWARVAAILVAALSIIGNFLSLPYYPAWSISIIVLNVVVIWAIATWRPDRE
ncbi:hypothetical protein F5X71_17330 [Nocardia brasiliensis]|uniref:DUF7144 domain-containing protein n=1 Tax=Nocardia brasiliensis TaxID=37326 RepID=A0A6G9XSP5_NOCBR|nr:hypothetical protein [Nocardia brasiliensis]QIS03853.1 hypothetical protein F5X71_17330 [Nocardia brasiliensis]